MSINFLLFGLAILFFIVRFFYKIKRESSKESNANNDIDSTQNVELVCNSIESKNPIKAIIYYPIKTQNSYLNPNDDFGTLKKGVVIDNQAYEYEFNENDSSNFTIIELGDESEVKSE